MATVIFSWSDIVHCFVIELCQHFSSVGVFPYPILKGFTDKFLPFLCCCRFGFVYNGFSVSVFVINLAVLKPQTILNQPISIYSTCSIGNICSYIIAPVSTFSCYIPIACNVRIQNIYVILILFGSFKQIKYKLPVNLCRNPMCSQTHGNFACFKVFRLHLFQCGDVGINQMLFMVGLCFSHSFSHFQL